MQSKFDNSIFRSISQNFAISKFFRAPRVWISRIEESRSVSYEIGNIVDRTNSCSIQISTSTIYSYCWNFSSYRASSLALGRGVKCLRAQIKTNIYFEIASFQPYRFIRHAHPYTSFILNKHALDHPRNTRSNWSKSSEKADGMWIFEQILIFSRVFSEIRDVSFKTTLGDYTSMTNKAFFQKFIQNWRRFGEQILSEA